MDKSSKNKVSYDLKKYSNLVYNIYKNSSTILYSLNPDGYFTFVSPQVKDILGYEPEELTMHYSDLFTESKVNTERLKMDERVFTEFIILDPHDIELYTKDGSKVWLQIKEIPFVENNKLLSVDGIAQDITIRKNMEFELKESQQRFFQLFETSPNLIAITTIEEGKFIDINENGAKILGYSKDDIIGKTTNQLGLMSVELRQKIATELKEKGSFEGKEYELTRKNGEKAVGLFHSQIIAIKDKSFFFHTIVDITDRKLAEKIIVDSENKYRLIVENQKDFILKFDTSGNLLFASSNYLMEFGVDESDIIGQKFMPEIHPDDSITIKPVLDKALKPPYTAAHEERMKTINGWKWVSWLNKPIVKDDGSVDEIISVGRDIDKRKKAEFELIQSEERFRNVINSLPDLVIIGDYHLKTLFINQAVKNLTGLSLSKFNENDSSLNFTHPDDRAYIRTFISDFIKSPDNTSQQLDNRFYTIEGELRWHSSIITKIVYQNEPALLFLVRDITERIESQQALKLSEEKFSKAFHSSNNAILLTRLKDGKIIEVNQGFEQTFGYSREEVINKTTLEIDIWKNKSEREYVVKQLTNGFSIKNYEVEFNRKQGNTGIAELSMDKIIINYEEHIISVVFDVTDKKEAELKLKENQQKLRSLTAHLQNVRERERQDIARGIHDELGQILTALKMNIKLLQLDIEKNDDINSEHIIDELKNLSGIVDESVMSAKRIIKDLRPELLDKLGLIPAIEQHLTEFCHLANLSYEFSYNEDQFDLEHDLAISIFRTVQEVLNNTVKYAEATKFELEFIYESNNISILLRDNGKGFDPNRISNRNSFGLFGINERVVNLGGSFNLESNLGSGTTISISIPLYN
jgi:PAS domain S-box-containing protein